MHSSGRERWQTWAVAATASLAVLLGATLWRYVRDFRLDLEDFPLVLHSSPPYMALREWTTWFTQGYTEYFLNYPDWHGGGYALSRPIMNGALYIQGLLAPSLGDPAYLIANYLAILASVPFLLLIFRRYAGLSFAGAAIVSVSIGLSPVWHQALFWPSLGTNALALCFSIAAIAVLFPESGTAGPRRIVVSAVLQVLAVASHETAIVLPVICALLLLDRGYSFKQLRRLWPFAMPLAFLLLTRLLLPADDGVYAFDIVSSEARLRVLRFLIGPFIPFEAMRMIIFERSMTMLGNIPLLMGVAANLAVYAVIGRALLKLRTRRFWILVLALLVALLVAVPTHTEPRFMGIALLLTMLVVLVATEGAPRLRNSVLALIILTQAALFVYGVVWNGESQYERMRSSGVAFDYLQENIAELEPDVVVLVNDRTGKYGSRAMLRMAAWPREDVEIVVLNGYGGPPAQDGSTNILAQDGYLDIQVLFGARQYVRFDGAVPDFSRPNSGFHYRSLAGDDAEERGSFEASRRLDGRRVLVLGTDLQTGQPFDPVVVDR